MELKIYASMYFFSEKNKNYFILKINLCHYLFILSLYYHFSNQTGPDSKRARTVKKPAPAAQKSCSSAAYAAFFLQNQHVFQKFPNLVLQTALAYGSPEVVTAAMKLSSTVAVEDGWKSVLSLVGYRVSID